MSGLLLYHGSRAVLQPGQLLLPPSQTGVLCASDLGYAYETGEGWHRRDRVYLSQDLREACVYAATKLLTPAPEFCTNRTFVGAGMVYVVQPLSDLEDDLEYAADGLSLLSKMAMAARVLEALPPPEEYLLERQRRAEDRWRLPA